MFILPENFFVKVIYEDEKKQAYSEFINRNFNYSVIDLFKGILCIYDYSRDIYIDINNLIPYIIDDLSEEHGVGLIKNTTLLGPRFYYLEFDSDIANEVLLDLFIYVKNNRRIDK